VNGYVTADGLSRASQIAARCSFRMKRVYALTKWKLSAQTYSTPPLALDPARHPRVPRSPHVSLHIAFAYAIILAYAVLEELGLHVPSGPGRSSAIEDPTAKGKKIWNPPVREDLEDNLRRAKIDLSEPYYWEVRGGRTRLEAMKPGQ
jgi:hypothetical protein